MLQLVLAAVTEFESHRTFTGLQRGVALKVFLAQFLNTGLIVLIVNAKTQARIPSSIGILTGQFSSFSARWYAGESAHSVRRTLPWPLKPVFTAPALCCALGLQSWARLW